MSDARCIKEDIWMIMFAGKSGLCICTSLKMDGLLMMSEEHTSCHFEQILSFKMYNILDLLVVNV